MASGEYQTIKLSYIDPRRDWNTRQGAWDQWSQDDEGQAGAIGFTQFRRDIAQRGLICPVLVRPVEKGKKPFQLVCGARRYEATRLNAEEAKEKEPSIRCIVRTMTDTEARIANLTENMQREDLRVQDEARTVLQLVKEFSLPQTAIAPMIQRTQGHVSKLLKAASVPARVFRAWSDSPAPLTLEEIGQCVIVPQNVEGPHNESQAWAVYEALVAKRVEPTDEKKREKKVESLKKRGEQIAAILGELVEGGYIEKKFEGIEFSEILEIVIPGTAKAKLKAHEKRAILKAMDQAFENALHPPREEPVVVEEGEAAE